MNDATKATVHAGPKGGTEYRLWTERGTYRVVGRFAALDRANFEAGLP